MGRGITRNVVPSSSEKYRPEGELLDQARLFGYADLC
jgi:hypothetical protein